MGSRKSGAALATVLSLVLWPVPARAKEPGALQVRSVPAGSRVYIEGFLAGQTPLQVDRLRPRSYRVVVERNGWAMAVEDVVIWPGEIARLEADLLPAHAAVPLSVRAEDDWPAVTDTTRKRLEKARSSRRLDDYQVLEVGNFVVQSDEPVPPDHLYALLPALARGLDEKTRFAAIVSSYTRGRGTRWRQVGDVGGPTLVLSGVITRYQPGSGARRWALGNGTGRTRMYCLFRLTDEATGEVVFERMENGSVSVAIQGASIGAIEELGRDIAKAIDRDWTRPPTVPPPLAATLVEDTAVIDRIEYLRGHPELERKARGQLHVSRSEIALRYRQQTFFSISASSVGRVAVIPQSSYGLRATDIGAGAAAVASEFTPFALPLELAFVRRQRQLLSIESIGAEPAERQLVLLDVHDHSARAAKKRIDDALGLTPGHYAALAAEDAERRLQRESSTPAVAEWIVTATTAAGDARWARVLIEGGSYEVLLMSDYVGLRPRDGDRVQYRLWIDEVERGRGSDVAFAPVFDGSRLLGLSHDGVRYWLL